MPWKKTNIFHVLSSYRYTSETFAEKGMDTHFSLRGTYPTTLFMQAHQPIGYDYTSGYLLKKSELKQLHPQRRSEYHSDFHAE